MSVSHLRLEEAPKAAIFNCPSHAVALFDSAFSDDFRLDNDMDVDPDAVSENLVKFCIGINILLNFGSSELAPETFTASIAVLGEGASSHS